MRTANDFELCVSALETSIINKRERLEDLYKTYATLEVDTPEEIKLEREIDSLSSEYREALKSYHEALELL